MQEIVSLAKQSALKANPCVCYVKVPADMGVAELVASLEQIVKDMNTERGEPDALTNHVYNHERRCRIRVYYPPFMVTDFGECDRGVPVHPPTPAAEGGAPRYIARVTDFGE